MTRVLIIEDDESFATLLKRSLAKKEFAVELVADLDAGLTRAQSGEFAVVLADVHLGTRSVIEERLTDQLRTLNPHLPVIIMTSKHEAAKAIEATKGGAYDYFAKPDAFDFDDQSPQGWTWVVELANKIQAAADRAAESKRLTARVRLPEDTPTGEGERNDRIVGTSRAMQEVFKAIGRAAPRDITVLVRGETGTGKELVARALFSHSDRAQRPFVVVNCAAIPEHLLESELFGHEKGAFTDAHMRRIGRFEQAHHGTIFLDEIGDMALPLQQKILRVLQEKTIERVGGSQPIPVDVRVIAATHCDLEHAVQQKEFRQDLYFRLNVAVISLPPLRARRDDIPGLVQYLLRRHGAELGSVAPVITPESIALLQDPQQLWPGNVRQLKNVVRKAILLARGYVIGPDMIREVLDQIALPRPAEDQTFTEYVTELLARAKSGELENAQEMLREMVDRELYAQAIQRANSDQSRAARWLGVSRPTMLEKLQKFGLHPAGH